MTSAISGILSPLITSFTASIEASKKKLADAAKKARGKADRGAKRRGAKSEPL